MIYGCGSNPWDPNGTLSHSWYSIAGNFIGFDPSPSGIFVGYSWGITMVYNDCISKTP